MALGTKYFEEDINHFKSMITTEEQLVEVVKVKMGEFLDDPRVQILCREQLDRSQENIDHYKEKIENLIEKGDEDG